MKLQIFWSFNGQFWVFMRALCPHDSPLKLRLFFVFEVIWTWQDDETDSLFYFLLWTPKNIPPAFFFQETGSSEISVTHGVSLCFSWHCSSIGWCIHFQWLKDYSVQLTSSQVHYTPPLFIHSDFKYSHWGPTQNSGLPAPRLCQL